MQKKALFNPRQTLVLAYLLAVVLWLVRCLAGSAVMLNYKMQGKMPQVTLAPDEFTTESFAAYSSNEWWTAPDDDPNWYLSTDSDPHIYWQGQGYIETVKLDAAHRLPPGGVALYYLKPGQTDYTEAQKVYAKVTAPGVYTFDLGGQWVTGLRIDPDSVGGVPTLFTGVTLNPDTPWYLRFIPAAGQNGIGINPTHSESARSFFRFSRTLPPVGPIFTMQPIDTEARKPEKSAIYRCC